MSDEFQLRKDAAKGARAQQWLDNEITKEILAGLERDFTEALLKSKPDEERARTLFYQAVNVVRKLPEMATAIASNGKLSQIELNKLTADTERKKRFGII